MDTFSSCVILLEAISCSLLCVSRIYSCFSVSQVLQEASKQMAAPLNDVYCGVLLALLKKRNLTKEVATNLIDEFAKAVSSAKSPLMEM